MLGLPQSTEYNRRINKNKLYKRLVLTSADKRIMEEQIKRIYWRNKIAALTMNLAEGKSVDEVEVFEIQLTSPNIDENILKHLDRQMHYHLLFILEYDNKYQAWIAYKEKTVGGNNPFKVKEYYHTAWMNESDLPITAEGLSLDDVYENFVKQINKDKQWQEERSLAENVARSQEIEKLNKKMETLKKKLRTEKQLNKQMALREELKKIKQEMELLL